MDSLAAPRYCDKPFPPYRYVPGRFPHPTAHPDGHSYIAPGHPHPRAEFYPPDQWRQSEEYLYGADLYNHGYWWEAHESWEALWQVCDKRSPQGHFLQTLIQVSACHMKLHENKLEGVRALLASSRTHADIVVAQLEPDEHFMGLDFSIWIIAVRTFYDTTLGIGPKLGAIAAYPYITLVQS